MKKNTNNVQDAISDLAALRPNWTLLADTLPAEFLQQVKGEIESLAAQRDALAAQLATLKKRVADAPRRMLYPRDEGEKTKWVAVLDLEDGE